MSWPSTLPAVWTERKLDRRDETPRCRRTEPVEAPMPTRIATIFLLLTAVGLLVGGLGGLRPSVRQLHGGRFRDLAP